MDDLGAPLFLETPICEKAQKDNAGKQKQYPR